MPSPDYRTVIASVDGGPVTSESGVRLLPDVSLDTLGPCHTLILVGGCGPRLHMMSDSERDALLRIGASARRVASVCTGTFLLAQLHLLDHCEATTHWRHAEALAARYPRIRDNADALYLRTGKVWTSAGVTSGIDMALYRGLRHVGVETQLVIYENAGHGFPTPKDRLAAMEHNRRWFDAHVFGDDRRLDLFLGEN